MRWCMVRIYVEVGTVLVFVRCVVVMEWVQYAMVHGSYLR